MIVAQAAIVLCGVTAVVLSQSPAVRTRRWAPVVGLAAQPAWFYETWTAHQMGMFALTIVYTLAWAYGIRTQWLA